VKLGDVLKKERERRKLSISDCAARLGIEESDYQVLESGQSPAEQWGPRLARIAVKLATPTSRLISETGRASDARRDEGQCGRLIAAHRARVGISREELSACLETAPEEIMYIESGRSPIEGYGPVLLGFAEVVDLPVFNLFYPCGLPLDALEDYP
jgi:transcriptional regulator with XRE-family HTH domain